MHLAIHTEEFAVRINHHRRVVVYPRRTSLKSCHNQRYPQLRRDALQFLSPCPGHFFRQIKRRAILRATEIRRCTHFLRTDNLCPSRRRLADSGLGASLVFLHRRSAGLLNKGYLRHVRNIPYSTLRGKDSMLQ